jgi:hypothetical protein
MQLPSIGRIVHFNQDGETQAAIVTGVYRGGKADESGAVLIPNGAIVPAKVAETDFADLTIFYRSGYPNPKGAVPFSAEPKPGHWNWPPRSA